MSQFKVVVEQHDDGYIAYPLGISGAVAGQGDDLESALAVVTSAIRFHIETLGPDVIDRELPVLDAWIAEVSIDI